MLFYFFITFTLYYIIIWIFNLGWQNSGIPKSDESLTSLPFVSVVIAVRNEEKNILKLMDCLADQSLPKNRYEVIIVNDNSTDKTVKIIENFMCSEPTNIQILQSDYQDNQLASPKKYALSKGIELSKGEIIVTTDGDCWFGKGWLKSMTSSFRNEKAMFVSGPVALKGENNLLSKIQTIEFASLIGSGGALINLKYPLMCNGANLAFRKSAFYHVDGYKGNMETMTGDDVFLMQKIHQAYKNSIIFIKKQDVIVNTLIQPTLSALVNQRKRWASKWNKNLIPFSWVLPVFLFIHYLSFLAGLTVILYDFKNYWVVGIFILLKIILDYIFLKKVMVFCKLQYGIWVFLLSEILYPFYALFFGIVVHFGNYTWKDRSHKI